MATGAAPALDPKAETEMQKSEEPHKAQPTTLKERVKAILKAIFEGREEYAGWRQ